MEWLNDKFVNWASILEEKTAEQAYTLSGMPFIFPHLALMPDAHLGKGATVGSVIPTLGAVIPAAVGVDIGCGMIAVRTEFTKDDFMTVAGLPALRESIERAIPMSAGKYTYHFTGTAQDRINNLERLADELGASPEWHAPNWRNQLGTLGSGNHFVEISLDEEDRVWLFLHSGSRGVGNKIAQYHIGVAQSLCKKWWIDLPDKDLAYLPEDTEEFEHYISELQWAQEFALLNREEMMDQVIRCVESWIREPVVETQRVNCHHNYTEQEQHFGKTVWLSRKGAINAEPGRWGLIPGSMGTASYVVQGLGNKLSLNSSPHGAGREYSRSAARKTFTMEQLEADMVGIEWRRTDKFLDEIPGAYKDIDVVMQDASDLVTIRHTLRQILNCKGN